MKEKGNMRKREVAREREREVRERESKKRGVGE